MRFRPAPTPEKGETDPGVAAALERLPRDFAEALADDLNAAAALAALFVFVKDVNVAIEEGRIGTGDRGRIEAVLADVDRVLGVVDHAAWPAADEPDEDDSAEIERLIQERNDARKRRALATPAPRPP